MISEFFSKIATTAGKRRYCPEGLIINYFKYFSKFPLFIYLVAGKVGYNELNGLLNLCFLSSYSKDIHKIISTLQ